MSTENDIYVEYHVNYEMEEVYRRYLNKCLKYNSINYLLCEQNLLKISFAALSTEIRKESIFQ